MAKGGGEGVYVLAVPEHDTVAAIKAEDGAHRATQAAVYALLERHRLADKNVLEAIAPVACPVLKNWRGLEIGKIRVKA